MSKIDDNKSMIVLVGASKPYAVSASAGRNRVMIDPNGYHIIVRFQQPIVLRDILIDIINVSVSRIIILLKILDQTLCKTTYGRAYRKKREHIKPIAWVITVFYCVGSQAKTDQSAV